MSESSNFNSNQYIFPVKVLACFFGLLLGFFIFAPTASMQNDVVTVQNNSNRMTMNGSYQPTPEPPKSTIRGRVVYADTGRPVRRAGLMLIPAKGLGGSGRENAGLTNERGEFEIKDVSEGRYFVSVSTPGVVTPFSLISNFETMRSSKETSEMADIAREFQEVVVNGVTDTDITIMAKRGAAISGRIVYADGEAAIGTRVEVLRKKDGQYSSVMPNISEMFGMMLGGAAGGLKTDDRGVFRVAGLPAGEYLVRVVENVSHSEKTGNRDDEMMSLMGFNPNSMVATYYPGTTDLKKAEAVKVELGQEQSEINITISDQPLHLINGIVINKATRQPLKEARISIKTENAVKSLFGSMSEFGSRNQTDEQGRWNYKELPAGKYTIIVEPPYVYETPDEKNAPKQKTPKLTRTEKEIVIEDKDLSDIVVEMGYGASISGTISFENSANLPASITIMATDEKGKFSEAASVYAEYSDQGKPLPRKTNDFKIEGIPDGRVYLSLIGAGTSVEGGANEPFFVKSILLNGKDITFAPLELKAGEEIKGAQIVLSKDVGKLKGKVWQADKTPAAGARLLFVPTEKQKWGNFAAIPFASTSGDGDFEVSGAPGEYFAVFINDSDLNNDAGENKNSPEKRREWIESKITDAQKVTIKAKEIETVNLILPDK